MTDKEEKGKFQILANKIGTIVDKKNKAYGDSFSQAGTFLKLLFPDGIPPEKYGDMLTIVRIFDKLKRIATDKGAFDEDPFSDIVGYGLLGVHNNNLNREKEFEKEEKEEEEEKEIKESLKQCFKQISSCVKTIADRPSGPKPNPWDPHFDAAKFEKVIGSPESRERFKSWHKERNSMQENQLGKKLLLEDLKMSPEETAKFIVDFKQMLKETMQGDEKFKPAPNVPEQVISGCSFPGCKNVGTVSSPGVKSKFCSTEHLFSYIGLTPDKT